MKKFQIQLNVFLITLLCSQVVAQNNWKNIKTIEDLYESYPNRLEFLFDQLDLNYYGLGEVKKSYEEQDLVTAARKLLIYYKKKTANSNKRIGFKIRYDFKKCVYYPEC